MAGARMVRRLRPRRPAPRRSAGHPTRCWTSPLGSWPRTYRSSGSRSGTAAYRNRCSGRSYTGHFRATSVIYSCIRPWYACRRPVRRRKPPPNRITYLSTRGSSSWRPRAWTGCCKSVSTILHIILSVKRIFSQIFNPLSWKKLWPLQIDRPRVVYSKRRVIPRCRGRKNRHHGRPTRSRSSVLNYHDKINFFFILTNNKAQRDRYCYYYYCYCYFFARGVQRTREWYGVRGLNYCEREATCFCARRLYFFYTLGTLTSTRTHLRIRVISI